MLSKSIDESNLTYPRLHSLILVLVEFKRSNRADLKELIASVTKFKQMTKGFLKADPALTFEAKLIIRRNYRHIDKSYMVNIN